MSTFITIKRKTTRQGDSSIDRYAVPAMAIQSAQGKILIPNPAGQEALLYDQFEEAVEAVKRAGFDYIFEGQKTYTLGKGVPSSHGTETDESSAIQLEETIPVLIDRLKDREPSVLVNTAYALGELRATAAIEALMRHLGHEDASVRKELAEALAKMGKLTISPLILAYENALSDSERKNAMHTRLTVISTFLELTLRAPEEIPSAFACIQKALRDPHWLVRAQAALIIGKLASIENNAQEKRKG